MQKKKTQVKGKETQEREEKEVEVEVIATMKGKLNWIAAFVFSSHKIKHTSQIPLLMLSFALLNLDANIVFDSPEVKQANKHKFLMQFICASSPGRWGNIHTLVCDCVRVCVCSFECRVMLNNRRTLVADSHYAFFEPLCNCHESNEPKSNSDAKKKYAHSLISIYELRHEISL